jgi:hypothetical protein
MAHLGVEVETTGQVAAAADRFKEASLATLEENDTSCCYARQDKVWVQGPGKEPWEFYVVKADSDAVGTSAIQAPQADVCCGTTACCMPEEHAVDPAQSSQQAKSAAGCGCTR